MSRIQRASAAVAVALAVAGLAAASASTAAERVAAAAGGRTVRCIGNGDFCGATISIAGGASNRQITVQLTDTDFGPPQVRVIPAASRGAFNVSHARFMLGGSEYRFTLNAVRVNPSRARILLLFVSTGAVRA